MKRLQRYTLLLPLYYLGLMSVISCRNDDPVEFINRPASITENSIKRLDDSGSYRHFLYGLLQAGTSFLQYPDSAQFRNEMFVLSYDTVSQMIYAAGAGNTDSGQENYELYLIAQRQAARKAAYEWALYLKTIVSQNRVVDKERIRGKIMYSRMLLEETRNDTLFQLYSIPYTSIVLQ